MGKGEEGVASCGENGEVMMRLVRQKWIRKTDPWNANADRQNRGNASSTGPSIQKRTISTTT